MFKKFLSNVLCVKLFTTKWLDLFEAVSIGVKSGPASTAWDLSKDAQFMLWSFVKKANFQGVMLICDKALSSSRENGYVLPQIMEELITFALLVNVINLQAIHNDFFYMWAK